MTATDIFVQRLETASGLPSLLAAGWDAFDFIAQTAPAYDDPGNDSRGFAFVLATSATCRGRNALAYAPSLPDDESGAEADVQALGDETQAATALADLAVVIWRRLTDASAGNPGHDDGRACEAALAAATEIHALLTGDSG